MKKMNKWTLLTLLAVIAFGCSKEDVEDAGPPPPPNPYMEVSFKFTQTFNGVDLNTNDTIIYENLAGNVISVNNLQYLISNIRLNDWEYNNHEINQYHLVNVKDPTTLTFVAKDSIKITDYNSIALFIGFREEDNKAASHPDLDNAGWSWPGKWGGGYYTFKMDGRYYSTNTSTSAIPYDMGIGGKKLTETQTDTSYRANELIGNMGKSGFSVPTDPKLVITKVSIEIILDVNKLFQDGNGFANYDLDTYPGNIEESAQGTTVASGNLQNAFKLGAVIFNDLEPE